MTSAESVTRTLAAYAAAVHARDLEATLATFSDDAVVLAPLTEALSGTGIKDFYRRLIDTSDLDITFTVEHVVGDPNDVVAVFTHSTGTRISLSDGTAKPVASREGFLLVPDHGALKIRHYLFNRTL